MAEVRLSRVLSPVAGERLTMQVPGGTLGEVVDALLDEMPGLRVHLFDQAGALRPHVLCVADDEAVRLDDRTMPVHRVEFLHAVSGG